MYFETYGKKENLAVIFLHGWGGCTKSWGNIPSVIAGFGFFAVVVDFSGFGKSEAIDKAYGVGDYANELEDLILKLNLTKFVLVGHSFGGRVAIKVACKNKGIAKLVLVNSAGIKPKKSISTRYKIWKYKRIKKKVEEGKLDVSILNNYGSSDYKMLSGLMRESFVKIVNEDLLQYAKMIDVNTLLFWGRNDLDTPLYMAKKLKKAIKKSNLIVCEAGHFSYLEHINSFIDELYLFLIS